MSFVRLENLNDFIGPATACVKPQDKKATAGVVAKVNDISLSDCLACSGCITSAESVLVQQQNHEELFKVINDSKSSKSVTSLAHKYCLSPQDAAERIASFFISIGCDKVYDINLARHLSLAEAYEEFKRRQPLVGAEECKKKAPIISSVCPGWVCYAEKTNGELIIPHLSKVRSPQQIMGAILKEHYSSSTGRPKSDIYHVTLMPCFDKKLEASRDYFKHLDNEGNEVKDVDCVLTPLELEEILQDEGVTLLDLEAKKLDLLFTTELEFDSPLTSHFGSVSGGYAENILLAEASDLLEKDESLLTSNLEYSIQRNSDFIELTLKKPDEIGSTKYIRKFAIINGFRNIQTVVQRLKRNALKYDYIEVMACPSGCINGGAQSKSNNGEDRSATILKTKELYNNISKVKLSLKSDTIRDKISKNLKLNNKSDMTNLLYTNFSPVQKMQNLLVNW